MREIDNYIDSLYKNIDGISKENKEIKSETTFSLEEESEVTFKYRYSIKEGELNITLKDENGKEQRLATVNQKGVEVIGLPKGEYSVQVCSNNFIGTYHIKAYKS